MERILVTGGAGFIAHHFIEHLLKSTDYEIVVMDKLTYAANGFDRLREVHAYDNPRVRVFPIDLRYQIGEGLERELGHIDYVVHMAAETHVDNSIAAPRIFVESNVVATFEMLELARRLQGLKRFLYFSTDEVFGPATTVKGYSEWDRYNSANPYAATKAAGEELCLAWANTYKVPIIITHTMNAFGERQHPEKFIPTIINSLLVGKTITIHASPDKKTPGSRFYIHCRNISAAVLFLLKYGQTRDKYNIVGELEVSNLDLAFMVGNILGITPEYKMVDFHSSRPGHDLRYALNGDKMARMGWKIPMNFHESLTKTVKWMTRPEHMSWLGWGKDGKAMA